MLKESAMDWEGWTYRGHIFMIACACLTMVVGMIHRKLYGGEDCQLPANSSSTVEYVNKN